MLLRSAFLFRLFAKRQLVTDFSPIERKKLEKVFLDDEIAKFFRWKRYKVNDSISFQGEAAIISWENFKIGSGTLDEALSMAKDSKLDLVHVRAKPPVVRLMNYKNWILSWAYKDKDIKTIYYKKNIPIFRLSHRITEADLTTKLKRMFELLESSDGIIIEARVNNENSLDEVRSLRAFEEDFPKKLRARKYDKMISIKVNSSDFSTKIFVKLSSVKRNFGHSSLSLNEPTEGWEEKIVHEPLEIKDDEEALFMNELLVGKAKPVSHSMAYDDDIAENILKPKNQIENQFEDPTQKIKTKIKNLIGDDLATKFLKGRLRV